MTPSPEDRILDATLVCLARYGVGKTTLDDVAREAGCARATVYRYFGGKQHLLHRTVEREAGRIVGAVDAATVEATTVEDALVTMATTAARMLTEHAALQFVLTHEREALLPAITFEGGDRFLADAARSLAPTFARFLPADHSERAAEWCARVFLAYLGADDAPISMTDAEQVRELVHDFVVPGLTVTVSQSTRG